MFSNYALCICTYRRVHLLQQLLQDLLRQILPDVLIIVDGDPNPTKVFDMLSKWKASAPFPVYYVPSNHPNLAYQRYLGWRVAKDQGVPFLLYLDDDLRIEQPDAVEKMLAPLFSDPGVVAVTARIVMGKGHSEQSNKGGRSLFHPVYPSRKFLTGALTPAGDRKLPPEDGKDYHNVEWLRGGAMAFRMNALLPDCFSEDLFALTHIGCGMGEDTFLARRVLRYGKLLYASCAVFLHPGEDTPKAYPVDPYKKARAVAYSRRLLNNIYRGDSSPQISDRLYLLRSYLFNAVWLWAKAITGFRLYRVQYALGYTVGAVRGIFQNPTSQVLTPHIDWWAEAEQALAQAQKMG
ncbi:MULTISPECIES: glycosyltransferase [Anaerolinea]|uniref:glycosyltransferase n=1 Tax=Anaerolinea TaxID=233189 RepID=UPI00263063E6|nr:glycosyltransferase [Anaerolinea thermophila]